MVYRKCGSSQSVKSGKQCYQCKDCGFQDTKEESSGCSKLERNQAIALSLLGLSQCGQ
jgi:transposase-like protein